MSLRMKSAGTHQVVVEENYNASASLKLYFNPLKLRWYLQIFIKPLGDVSQSSINHTHMYCTHKAVLGHHFLNRSLLKSFFQLSTKTVMTLNINVSKY